MTKFIIISDQRSGSTFLCNKLESFSNIVCHDEVFLKRDMPDRFINYSGNNLIFYNSKSIWYLKRVFLFYGHLFKVSFSKNKNKLIDEFLNNLYKKPSFPLPHYSNKVNRNNLKAVGLKIMYDQILYHEYLFEYINKNNIKVIFLRRRNLDQFVSQKMAKKTGLYHKFGNSDTLNKIHVNLKTYNRFLRKKECFEKNILSRIDHSNILFKNFEDIILNVNDVLDFLNIRNQQIVGVNENLKKVINKDLSEIVSNFEQVSKL